MKTSDWKNKELDKCYIFVYVMIDDVYVREGISIKKREMYTFLGINVEGRKRILGVYILNENNNHFWMNIFNEFKYRGVEDIIFIISGNNINLMRGKKLVFPNTIEAPLLLHIIDKSTKYIAKKEYRSMACKIRQICVSNTLEDGQKELDLYYNEIDNNKVVKLVIDEYKNQLLDTYKYHLILRKMMFSMSPLERIRRHYKRELRKVNLFESCDDVIELTIKVYTDLEKTWIYSKRDWNDVINLVGVDFEERIIKYL